MECNDELLSNDSSSLPLVEYSDSDNEMDVTEVHSPQTFAEKEIQETMKPVKKRQKKSQDKGSAVKQLLRLISIIIPHMNFPCKTSIGRRVKILTITLR